MQSNFFCTVIPWESTPYSGVRLIRNSILWLNNNLPACPLCLLIVYCWASVLQVSLLQDHRETLLTRSQIHTFFFLKNGGNAVTGFQKTEHVSNTSQSFSSRDSIKCADRIYCIKVRSKLLKRHSPRKNYTLGFQHPLY